MPGALPTPKSDMRMQTLVKAFQPSWSNRRRWLAGVLLLGMGRLASAQPTPTRAAESKDDVITLPKVTVAGELLKEYPMFPKADVKAPSFAERSAPIDLFYPGSAYADGVNEGTATVGVMLDASGKPKDFLLIRYTRRYFGDALMRAAHDQDYAPRYVRGMAVPGRFNFGYRFVPTIVLQMNSFNAIEERDAEIQGGPSFIYEPHLERDIDGGALESTASTVAFIPDGYVPPKGKPVRAFVSFYVDETGRVRLPNVESADSPLLIPNAIKAVEHWAFRPPTLKGKPVLVFTLWAVAYIPFVPPTPPPKP